MTDDTARCAYPDCQAGGVILEGAIEAGLVVTADNAWQGLSDYHPGCWAAERRASEAAR